MTCKSHKTDCSVRRTIKLRKDLVVYLAKFALRTKTN